LLGCNRGAARKNKGERKAVRNTEVKDKERDFGIDLEGRGDCQVLKFCCSLIFHFCIG
jgi:hypothetical protein